MTKKINPIRISRTMAYLLRHRPEAGRLEPDPEGWVPIDEVARAVGALCRGAVREDDVRAVVNQSRVQRFEIDADRIRARKGWENERRLRREHGPIPDILYHATSGAAVTRARKQGVLRRGHRPLILESREEDAWFQAHLRHGDDPRVLYVDTTRARRRGVRFRRNPRTGLYTVRRVACSDILNLQSGFAEQRSAGGIPVRRNDAGQVEMALIEVTRRSGVTWEVAKGKLEPGETPEAAALREVREEMGIESDLRITGYVGLIRYGFLAPGGRPRLKSVYLYLMESHDGSIPYFRPRAAEGIGDVRWFSPEEACRAVTHSSLRPIMQVARRMVE